MAFGGRTKVAEGRHAEALGGSSMGGVYCSGKPRQTGEIPVLFSEFITGAVRTIANRDRSSWDS
jgi:hypothetical protein